MKKHSRKLLILLPFLPLLMANSPAPQRETYRDLEATYLSVETLHGYNFYHFNIKNVGTGYVNYLNLDNKPGDKSFYASLDSNEIVSPFDNVIIEPGFDKEVIVVTKNEIPESKEVQASAYDFYVAAEDITFDGSKEVTYSPKDSYLGGNVYTYSIDVQCDGTLSENYDYCAAIKLTYDGASCFVRSSSVEKLYFTTSESLDLNKLTIDEITMLRSKDAYQYRDYYGIGCKDFLNAFLLFLLVFFLFLGFGIFSAIFFPAMARRRRRNRLLQEQNNK